MLYKALKENSPETLDKVEECLGGCTSIRIEEVFKKVKQSAIRGKFKDQMIMAMFVLVYNRGHTDGMKDVHKML